MWSINRLIKISALMVLACLLLSRPVQAQIVGGSNSSGASQPFACNTNNASCVTQNDNTATSRTLLLLDNNNILNIGVTALNSVNTFATNSVKATLQGTTYLQVNVGQIQALNGAVMLVVPAALASFPACAAGTEGAMATQTNSTAACSAGATATSAGTTHCQIYCNGTNWVQTGR